MSEEKKLEGIALDDDSLEMAAGGTQTATENFVNIDSNEPRCVECPGFLKPYYTSGMHDRDRFKCPDCGRLYYHIYAGDRWIKGEKE